MIATWHDGLIRTPSTVSTARSPYLNGTMWSPAASSGLQRARVLTGVKTPRSARPRSAGLTALTPAPRTLVQIGP